MSRTVGSGLCVTVRAGIARLRLVRHAILLDDFFVTRACPPR